ncbi:hypothetical protein RHS01_07608 [Rhizoctonia solani]|uniref:Uncharacterized protein n=1 Tax=Rhizoctonia solani TaxID=456999 RepID=A0A8H7I9S4_9AGAM|nr:hypothetical protein RHS01_07608 [Rhizoctonia solani]
MENLPQRASQSTGKRLKPCIIRASKLVIQQPNSHAPKVALGSFAAAQSCPVTTTGQPVCPSEFPLLQAQPLYPLEPWGQLGAPAPLTAIPTCPLALWAPIPKQPPPPNWAPSQAPPPGCNHFDHNTGPQDLLAQVLPAQVPPPIKHLHLIAPQDLLSRIGILQQHQHSNPAQHLNTASSKLSQGATKCWGVGKSLQGRTPSQFPPMLLSTINNNMYCQTQPEAALLAPELCFAPNPRGLVPNKRGVNGEPAVTNMLGEGMVIPVNDCKAMKLPDKDKGGMEGDEDKPIDTHKSSSCGQLKDFHGPEKHVLQWAGCLFIAIMASRGMYKTDIKIIDQRQLKAWTTACKGIKVDPNDYPIALAHMENLDDHLCAWHTQLGARDRVFPAPTPSNLPEQNFHRELICFSCAIIQFLVEEWDTGVRVRSNLNFETQQKAYTLTGKSHGVSGKHSSASKLAIPLDNKNVLRHEDVQSNTPSKQELAAWQEEQATMDNTQQIGVDQGFKQDGEDWAKQDRLPQSTANLINRAMTATTFKPGSIGKPRTVIQSAARLVRTTTESTTQTKTHVKAQTLILSAAAIAKDLAITAIVNIHRTGMTSWGTQNSSQTTIIVITDFDNRNERQGQGGWDYCLQSGLQHSNYNHHDSHLLQDNHHGCKDRNAVPRVDHSLSGGARNTHNQRKYPQGGSFNNGGYYQHQGTSQSRNPPNNHPQSPQNNSWWDSTDKFGDNHNKYGNNLTETQRDRTMGVTTATTNQVCSSKKG